MKDSVSKMDEDVIVKCENVSKKFCRGLKRSLWYGVQDICAELNPLNNDFPTQETCSRIPALRKDEFWAVNDISFELKRGECLGLIGHNGAGKSTLLKMLNGLIKPDCGRITMKGRISALIELNAGFNPILTGRENIYIYGAILGFTKEDINKKYDAIVDFAELHDFIEMPVRSYSSGMKVRLGFSVAAQMEPDILLIDEVLAVGDIGFRSKCLNKIHNLLSNTCIIFVSHSMVQIARISTHILLLKNGNTKYLSNDIGKGTSLYYEEFPVSLKTTFSNGTTTLSQLTIGNISDSQNPYLLDYNNDLLISFKLTADKSINKIMYRISIWDSEFVPIIELFDDNGDHFIFQNNSDEFKIEVNIPHLTLNGGKYTISIVVYDYDNFNIIYREDNAASFNVEQRNSSGAKTFIHSTSVVL